MDEFPKTDMAQRPRHNRAHLVLTLLAFAVAGAASWEAAIRISDEVENRTARQMRAALTRDGHGWVTVATDGLTVRLTGTAPDEVARFRALTAASGLVDDRRIVDGMEVAERDLLEPPDFEMEIMRQGDNMSLIGLVPASTDREEIASRFAARAVEISDLTSTAAFPAPESWNSAVEFAMQAALLIDQGTVSITPEKMVITANAASADDRSRLEAALRDVVPEGMAVEISVSAPLPVIAPYRLRFTSDGDNAALESCAAETEATREVILSAATEAGVTETPECPLGIGAPSGWSEAAAESIASVARIGAGTVEMTDNAIQIVLPADIEDDAQEAETARLAASMPADFNLNITRAETSPHDGPPHFLATIGAEGLATIEGGVPDETMRQTVQSLARAQLGPLEGELRLDPSLREGWALRVMAGLDAMGAIDTGQLEVTPDSISLSGISGDTLATERAIAALATRLGAGAEYMISIAYDPRRDPGIVLPDGTDCVDRLNAVMLQSEIGFEPGGARIAGDIGPVIEELRPIMEECADYRLELAGHTDSQGSDTLNMSLSLSRAEAVLGALAEAGLSVEHVVARGYGETRPIAENDTEEGREANRRIELTLISPEPVPAPVDAAPIMTGTTPSAQEAQATLNLSAPIEITPVVAEPSLQLPVSPFGEDALSDPPKLEPPAEVLPATPDTPRPPERPEDEAVTIEEPT
ncbi:OmpA family protein [Paracoccus sediminicola]|uniref:OmpA family protein n=1 Tax=Paracoccus sediminicola TaxID=3017783 RepID=UPI0022F08559|nr:OmpA family protein [Paracoccus sediminicola]WBU58285.1 OmpA family protein [Paracoccus sediminicola]